MRHGTIWQAADGLHALDLSGCEKGTIEQWIHTTPDQQHTLPLILLGDCGGDPIESVLLGAGQTQQTFTFDTTGVTHLNMNWTLRELDLTGTDDLAGIPLASQSPLFWGPALDDLRVTVVPTPGAPVLMALGANGLAIRRRRKTPVAATC